MRRSLAWLAGALGLAGAYKALKGHEQAAPAPVAEPSEEGPAGEEAAEEQPDPRAEELRQRLEEAKPLVAGREEDEAGETPVDRAPDPAPRNPEEKRRDVHERARAAIDEMRGEGES